MSGRTCPMVARGSWDVASAQQRDSWHRLCKTQSPAGLRGNATGAWLVFLSGSHRGEDARLAVGTTVVGSAWSAELVLTGPDVGSQHATLVVADWSATIAPSGQSRDVRVNGERISSETTLVDADLISFGELHAILRFAKFQTPGYRPTARPRPTLGPALGHESRLFTAGWLIALTQARYGQDWRLVKGVNRLGSELDIEIYWPENGLPAHAIAIDCALDKMTLSEVNDRVRVTLNGTPATVGSVLRDSDRIKLNDAEFYVKCL